MKLFTVFLLVLFIEIQHVCSSTVDVRDNINFDIGGNEGENFQHAFGKDILGFTKLTPDQIQLILPHLRAINNLMKENPTGRVFEYLIELCDQYSTLRNMNKIANNMNNFVAQGGELNGTNSHAATNNYFSATRIINNKDGELENEINKIEMQKKKANENEQTTENEFDKLEKGKQEDEVRQDNVKQNHNVSKKKVKKPKKPVKGKSLQKIPKKDHEQELKAQADAIRKKAMEDREIAVQVAEAKQAESKAKVEANRNNKAVEYDKAMAEVDNVYENELTNLDNPVNEILAKREQIYINSQKEYEKTDVKTQQLKQEAIQQRNEAYKDADQNFLNTRTKAETMLEEGGALFQESKNEADKARDQALSEAYHQKRKAEEKYQRAIKGKQLSEKLKIRLQNNLNKARETYDKQVNLAENQWKQMQDTINSDFQKVNEHYEKKLRLAAEKQDEAKNMAESIREKIFKDCENMLNEAETDRDKVRKLIDSEVEEAKGKRPDARRDLSNNREYSQQALMDEMETFNESVTEDLEKINREYEEALEQAKEKYEAALEEADKIQKQSAVKSPLKKKILKRSPKNTSITRKADDATITQK